MSAHKITQDASVKIGGTYMSIVGKGIGPAAFNVITLMTIYNSAVLPKALYWSELWCNVSAKDLAKLHKAHLFCIKHIQGLRVSTSTDFSLVTVNSVPLETIVDCNKLKFFGQLCRLCPRLLQSEHIGQCDTPHHLSDVHRGAPSWIWDYFLHSDVNICVLNAIYML